MQQNVVQMLVVYWPVCRYVVQTYHSFPRFSRCHFVSDVLPRWQFVCRLTVR